MSGTTYSVQRVDTGQWLSFDLGAQMSGEEPYFWTTEGRRYSFDRSHALHLAGQYPFPTQVIAN